MILSLFLTAVNAQSGWFKVNELPKSEHRNPGASFAGSLIFPGYGYLSNDMMKEGFITLGIESALIGAGFYFITLPVQYKSSYAFGPKTADYSNRNYGYIFLGVAGGLHLFQAVHSTILSHKFNVKNGLASNRSKGPQLDVQSAGIGLSLKLRF